MSLLQRVKKLELLRRYEDSNLIVLTTHGIIIRDDKVLSFRDDHKCVNGKKIPSEWLTVRKVKDSDIKDYNEEQELRQILYHYKGRWESKEDLNKWIDDNFASFLPEEVYSENDTVINVCIEIAWPRGEEVTQNEPIE